jgi:hypothetical protein
LGVEADTGGAGDVPRLVAVGEQVVAGLADEQDKITPRHHGRVFEIGIGRPDVRTRVVCLIKDLDIGIIDTATGEILRTLTIDSTRTCQPTGKPQGGPTGPRKPNNPNP